MKTKIATGWQQILRSEFEKPYFETLSNFVKSEYENNTIYPPEELIFNAFNLCAFEKIKVVIIGQDPYHGEGQAHGLCFSVNDGVAFPPSLRNIFKEIESDLQTPMPTNGNLERWARQGVLLLNATLTVRAGEAASHQKQGWETFANSVIQTLSDNCEGLVFMLWGAYAQKKGAVINASKHLILTAAHPSPLSANRGGFFACKHFSKANKYLQKQEKTAIMW